MNKSLLLFPFTLYLLSYSIYAQWLEASMIRHVLIQIPCLVLIGYLFAYQYLNTNRFLTLINEKGLAGILLCIFIGGYWMLPRALDAALLDPAVAFMKYISLPFFVGIPLAISWKKIHPIARAVIKIEFLTMLFRLGWLYLVSPIRLCNFYQLNEQIILGKCFLIIAISLSLYWILQLFAEDYQEEVSEKNKLYG